MRFRAVWALGKIGDARALGALILRTGDPDARVAYDATLALGQLGAWEAVPYLREMAGQCPDPVLADTAVMALRHLNVQE